MTSIIDDIHKMVLDDLPIGLYDAEVEAEKVRKTMLKGARLEGLEQGIEQKQNDMVKRLYQNGVSLEIIAASANISIEEVEKIISSTTENT